MANPNKIIATASLGAIGLLSTLEGFSAKPYRDVGGVWTDCYGNTHNVTAQTLHTPAECKSLLAGEAQKIAQYDYSLLTRPVSARTLGAYTSFTYNVGNEAFKNSSVLRLHNQGLPLPACKAMFQWVNVKGVYSVGLYNRRKIEVKECILGIES